MTKNILKEIVIILSDKSQSRGIFAALKEYHDDVIIFNNPIKAIEYLKYNPCNIAITETDFTLIDGLSFFNELVENSYTSNIILMQTIPNLLVPNTAGNSNVFSIQKPIKINNLLEIINTIHKEEL